jgi:hypothetical protein
LLYSSDHAPPSSASACRLGSQPSTAASGPGWRLPAGCDGAAAPPASPAAAADVMWLLCGRLRRSACRPALLR